MAGAVMEWTSTMVDHSAVLKGAGFNSWSHVAEIRLDKLARPQESHAHYGVRLSAELGKVHSSGVSR